MCITLSITYKHACMHIFFDELQIFIKREVLYIMHVFMLTNGKTFIYTYITYEIKPAKTWHNIVVRSHTDLRASSLAAIVFPVPGGP